MPILFVPDNRSIRLFQNEFRLWYNRLSYFVRVFEIARLVLILTVTPNAAVDKTYRIAPFLLDRVNRPCLTHTLAGGKGINVARVYQTLGGKAIVAGFLGGVQGEIVKKALDCEGLTQSFIEVEGETRLCIAIIDPVSGTQTEINEQGPRVTAQNARELIDLVRSLLSQRNFEFVVLSGSLPPEAPDYFYAELIDAVKASGVKTVFDSSGVPLQKGLKAKPWMAKLNRSEMETAVERSLPTDQSLLDAALELHETGIPLIIATNGSRGAYLAVEGQNYIGSSAKVEFASAVASGDSFLAAFLWALSFSDSESSEDYAAAFKLALGAGSANAAVIGAGLCTRDSIFELARKCEVKRGARLQ